jgi:hypothetical protein
MNGLFGYTTDVCYAKATPSNSRLIDHMADEWVAMANRADTAHDRGLCLAKAAYWRSVLTTAFPATRLSRNHGLG